MSSFFLSKEISHGFLLWLFLMVTFMRDLLFLPLPFLLPFSPSLTFLSRPQIVLLVALLLVLYWTVTSIRFLLFSPLFLLQFFLLLFVLLLVLCLTVTSICFFLFFPFYFFSSLPFPSRPLPPLSVTPSHTLSCRGEGKRDSEKRAGKSGFRYTDSLRPAR